MAERGFFVLFFSLSNKTLNGKHLCLCEMIRIPNLEASKAKHFKHTSGLSISLGRKSNIEKMTKKHGIVRYV